MALKRQITKKAVAVCWALGTCSPDGAWRKVTSASDIHSPELLGLPVSLRTSHFSQGSGHSQGIKGWYPPSCWPGELRRVQCASCCAAGARPVCILERAESVRREDTVRTVRRQETSKPAGRGGSTVSGHGACGGGMGEAHTRASKGRVCSALGHRPEMIFLGPGFLLGKSSAIFPWGALLLLRCSSWGNSLEPAGVQVRSVDRRLKRIKTPGEVGLPRGNPHPQTTTQELLGRRLHPRLNSSLAYFSPFLRAASLPIGSACLEGLFTDRAVQAEGPGGRSGHPQGSLGLWWDLPTLLCHLNLTHSPPSHVFATYHAEHGL